MLWHPGAGDGNLHNPIRVRFKQAVSLLNLFQGIGMGDQGSGVQPAGGNVGQELAAVADALASGADLRADERTEKHADWAEGFKGKYTITADNALDIVEKETGLVFAQVLEHAGVYKRTAEGKAAFLRFLEQI